MGRKACEVDKFCVWTFECSKSERKVNRKKEAC
jgi:hypothetical protein